MEAAVSLYHALPKACREADLSSAKPLAPEDLLAPLLFWAYGCITYKSFKIRYLPYPTVASSQIFQFAMNLFLSKVTFQDSRTQDYHLLV